MQANITFLDISLVLNYYQKKSSLNALSCCWRIFNVISVFWLLQPFSEWPL